MSDEQEREERLPNGFRELPAEPNPTKQTQPHEEQPQRRICGAKTRSGGVCQKLPISGRTRCRLHGGLTPCGAASPHFKHGRRTKYAKAMPKALRQAYKAALDNEDDLLSLNDETALLESRITQLLKSLSTTEAPPWGMACEKLNDIKIAKKRGDKRGMGKSFAQLEKIIRQGSEAAESQQLIWADIMDNISLKTKTASTEMRRLETLDMLIPVQQVMVLVTSMMETIKSELLREHDEQQAGKILSRIARQIYSLLPSRPTPIVIANEQDQDQA